MEIAYKKAADEAGLTIAEVGVWRNTLAADPDERKRWIDYAIRQLRMALWVAVIQQQTRRDNEGTEGCQALGVAVIQQQTGQRNC